MPATFLSISSNPRRLGLLLILASVAWIGAAGRVAAAESTNHRVVVELASGRRFAGEVDRRTDERTLWISNPLRSGQVLRPVDWTRVTSVELDGELYSGEQFHEAVGEVCGSLAADSEDAGEVRVVGAPADIILGPAESPPRLGPPPLEVAAAVRSLAVEAQLANWDADVEPDGLILDVLPLDLEGHPVAVSGSIAVELLAERVGVVQLPNPFERIGYWTRRVSPDDFGVYGARYRLPFQAVNPDFERRFASHGAVHVRLSVPGAGVFEQTDSTLRIRPYSSVRDRLEETTGRRYFYQERVGRGER